MGIVNGGEGTDRPVRAALWRRVVPVVEWAWLGGALVLELLNRVLVPLPVWVLIPITFRSYWFVPLLPVALWALLRRRSRRHLAALIGVGMWVIGSLAAVLPGRSDPGAPGLRVLTWNVQRGYSGSDRVAAVITGLEPALAALQEVSRPRGDRTDLVSRLEDGGGLACSFSPYYETPDSPGVALCVHPSIAVTTAQRRTYHSRGKWSYLFAEAVIEGRTVNVIVPHLVAFSISGVDPVRDHRTVLRRLTWASRWHHREVDELLRLVAGFKDPTIMAGDFNSTPGLAFHGRIRERMVDAFAAAGQGSGATFTFGLPIRIDYIYLSHEIEPVWAGVGPAGASDHRPVVATVRLPPLPEAGGDAR